MDPTNANQRRRRLFLLLWLRQRERQRQQNRRSCWVRPILLRREQCGEFHTLVQEMRESDPNAHQRYFRMSVAEFDEILDKVAPGIAKACTQLRDPIVPAERLAITLR